MAHLKEAANVTKIEGATGTSIHSYTEEETESFADYINTQLGQDADLSHLLPLKEPKDLFSAVGDGLLICKLINTAVPSTIDLRVVNKKKKMNPWEKNENLNLAINSAKSIGVHIVNVGPIDFTEGRPHIVLGVVWQIIKIGLLKDINLKEHKELVLLLKDGEEISSFLSLPPEDILIRWVNYHLNKAGSKKKIANFSNDIKDSEAYSTLLTQIAPNKECSMSPMEATDLTERAEKMLQEADKIGCKKFVSPKDVVAGNAKLNLAFVANLFNNHPALFLEENENIKYDFAELLDFDAEGTREERAFRMWIQSLGIDLNNLFEDVKDGIKLLQVQDKISPGIVDWKKVDMKPKMKLMRVQNTNYVIKLAEQMKLSIVNIGGVDLVEGKKKLVLALVWQMMRYNLLAILKELGGGKQISDDDLLKWANEKVKTIKIDKFNDKSLKTGVFLNRLCHAVAPQSCNLDFVTAGETDEEAEQNAKYALSVARKIGASVFLNWEDVVEVNAKLILSFVAALKKAEVDYKKSAADHADIINQ